MIVGTVKETYPGERRVALVPASVPALVKAGLEVLIEPGAGEAAGFIDDAYREAGASVEGSRDGVFEAAEVICQVRTLGANPEAGRDDLPRLQGRHTVVGCADPLSGPEPNLTFARTGARLFAMELMPRITRAQSMDVLSSQATIGGYKAVIVAAEHLPRMFPMMMTAAGTISPARVLVIGAGVAGLQAIATARKNGAVVTGYDIRPAVREQVESLGGKFLEVELEAAASEDQGGYAKAMDEEFYRRQREVMAQAVAGNDVVITTAAVPGRKSPVLITAEMVAKMAPGSVVVDLAAERGGNCELTKADEVVVEHGVTILGPTNLAATVPYHASQMYSRNLTTFLTSIMEDGAFNLKEDDEVVQDTLLCRDGDIVQPRVREVVGLETPAAASGTGSSD